LLGKCDDIVEKLCRALGWEKRLDQLWAETVYSLDPDEEGQEPVLSTEEEVKKLAKEVEETLRVTEHHLDTVTSEIEKKGQNAKGDETPKVSSASKTIDTTGEKSRAAEGEPKAETERKSSGASSETTRDTKDDDGGDKSGAKKL